jgi:glycosyltransferase involved in cell wall biosynthesis
MNILFVADPNSIHDLKWMSFFSTRYSCFLIARHEHKLPSDSDVSCFFRETGIRFLGTIPDIRISSIFELLPATFWLIKLIRAQRIRLIHIMYAEPNALWALFFRLCGLKIIITTRGSDILRTIPYFFKERKLRHVHTRFLYRRAFRHADLVTCTSSSQAKAIRELLCRNARIQIIRTGALVSSIEATSPQYSHPDLRFKGYILFPRLMQPVYNHEFALAAIAELSTRARSCFKFVFVDRDGDNHRYIHGIGKLISSIDAKIIWLNRLDSAGLWSLIKGAALVVMTNKSDGTPVTAIEAMICRTPLILPPLDYDEDLFGDGILKFKEWKSAALSSLIEMFIDGEISVDLLSLEERAKRFGDTEVEMSRLDAVYRELLKE